MKKTLIATLLVAGVIALIILVYVNSKFRTTNRIFSDYSLLSSTWEKYKAQHIETDGRVIDYSQDKITTSEGQSYALLRAVWSDDKEIFDTVWEWTRTNLNRQDDSLFGWRWGEREDGSFGFMANGGENSATDGDSDIALALIFATQRWNDPAYQDEAIKILNDIWIYSTEDVNGKRYLLAGRWATSKSEIVLNPSYFMPYSWRIFDEVDPTHDWNSLINPAYEVLTESGRMTLRDQAGVGLPPNWISLAKPSGELKAPEPIELSTTYSYDAMRIPWRIALDYLWYKDEQALTYLQSLSRLSQAYTTDGLLTSTYNHDGTAITTYESPSMYATALSYFQLVEPELGQTLYRQKIEVLYSNDTNTFKEDLNYYDLNWLWFSIALYSDSLPNLYLQPTL